MMLKTQWVGAGVAAVVLTIFVRIGFIGAFSASPMYEPHPGAHDRTLYHEAAQAVADGDIWPDGAFEYLPLYPWVLGAGYAIFGDSLLVPAGLGLACEAVTVWLIVLLARRLGARWWMALMAAGLYALYPLAVVYSPLTMPNTLNAMLVTAWAWAMQRMDSRRMAWCAGAGLVGGVTALGFAAALTVAVAFLLWEGIRGVRVRAAPWRGMAVFALAFALPVLPVAVHNSKAEGAFVLLTTHGGFNFYMGNHERATGYPVRVRDFRMTARAMLEDAHRAAELEMGRSLSRAESSAWWTEQGRAYWRANPLEAAGLTLKKAALFWNFRDVDDLRMREQLELTDGLFAGWWWPGFALFSVLGIVGLLFARNAVAPKIVLLSGMVSLVLFFITARYRLTLIPVMAALGASGLSALWPMARVPVRRALWLIPAVLVIGFPFEVRDLRVFDYYNASVQVLGSGRAEQALALSREGLAIDPANADLYHAQGGALAQLDRYEEAAQAFQWTVTLNPRHATGRYNLALSLARLGQVCEAAAVLEEWIAIAPQDQRSVRLHADLRQLCDNE